jgi:hypothetical protein
MFRFIAQDTVAQAGVFEPFRILPDPDGAGREASLRGNHESFRPFLKLAKVKELKP